MLKTGDSVKGITLSESQQGRVQVQIGQMKFTALSSISLKAGEAVTLQVNRGGPLPQLSVVTNPTPPLPTASAAVTAPSSSGTTPSQIALPLNRFGHLSEGTTLNAKVVDARGDKLLLQIGTQRVVAQTTTPHPPSTELKLQVSGRTQSQLLLQPLPMRVAATLIPPTSPLPPQPPLAKVTIDAQQLPATVRAQLNLPPSAPQVPPLPATAPATPSRPSQTPFIQPSQSPPPATQPPPQQQPAVTPLPATQPPPQRQPAVTPPPSQPPSQPSRPVEQGAIVEAKVIATKGELLILQLGKEQFPARSEPPLPAGTAIKLQLTATTATQITLQQLPESHRPLPSSLPSNLSTLAAPRGTVVIPTQPNWPAPPPEGAIRQAKVVAVDGNLAQLQLGGDRVWAKVGEGLALKPGATLLLQSQVREGQAVVLQPLQGPFKAVKQIETEALRLILPRQQPLAEGLGRLMQLVQDRTVPLPPAIRQLAEQTLTPLLNSERAIDAKSVQQALQNSGLLAEAKLLTRQSSEGDLKLNLMRLVNQLQQLESQQSPRPQTAAAATTTATAANQQQLVGELLRVADSSVARIQAHQLESIPKEEQESQRWHFELPLKVAENRMESLDIVIEREPRGQQSQQEPPWHLTLQIHLQPLGAIRAKLTLQGERISSTFWAEDQLTLGLLNQSLPLLQRGFAASGFELGDIEALFGKVERPTHRPQAEFTSLINERV
ncbi:flagellar hook-length control protein FliK [Ectothiorhodospiraceae bacterium BW-2]|nr:flagellar hook-length control protein FliK [Ectothiorhodospiraceae bacterium BW-2]